MQVFKS